MARKWIASIAIIATVLVSYQVFHNHELCEGFLPENNLYIPANLLTQTGISEQQFNEVMDRIERIYTPEVANEGGKLKVNRLWTNGTVNASATRSGNIWNINMYGGLARHAAITVEGMALVACHEIGHHLAGAPKIRGWFTNWASNEGASDYFSTLKCLRRYFAEDDNKAILATAQLDTTAVAACQQQFTNEVDQWICLRSSVAGQSVADLFKDLKKDPVAPNYATPDPKKVTQIDDRHPATQCRLDTYFAGFTCPVDVNTRLSNTDYREGSCYAPRDPSGTRPGCWFVAQ